MSRGDGTGRQAVRELLYTLERDGFRVLRTSCQRLGNDRASEFYAEHKGKFFEKRLVSFMADGGPVMAVLLERDEDEHGTGNSAIARWRALQGATHADVAEGTPAWTFRAAHGTSDTRNASHGSDAPQTAAGEIAFFFPDFKG